jgi:thiamine biosynthesis lipoprotein
MGTGAPPASRGSLTNALAVARRGAGGLGSILPLALALIATAPVGDAATRRATVSCHEESRIAMGCTAIVRACGPDARVLPGIVGEALDEIDRIDRLMSHYRRDSPLSRLNREAANGPVAVDPELLAFLAECLRWSRESDGAFDITVGPLMKAWGFFRDEGRVPGEDELAQALSLVGHRHVLLDRAKGTVRFDRPGVELDPGGIGKGYAVDRVVELLRRRGVASALVNLGGSSVYGLGAPPGRRAWEVGIQDPTGPGKSALTVRLRNRALSVSGGYERFFEKDGVTYSHIMDPRTGRPVQGVLSVAVLTDTATTGDALDDVAFVQGVEQAAAFLKRLPSTEALFFLPRAGSHWKLVRVRG